MDSNRGWDTTSDEDDGMEIDLDAKQDDNISGQKEAPIAEDSRPDSQQGSQTDKLDYDPSEPTDDYDPLEPTPDEDSGKVFSPQTRGSGLVADYDPAEPTLSEEERDDEVDDNQSKINDPNQPKEDSSQDFSRNEDDENSDGRWDSQRDELSQEEIPSSFSKGFDSADEDKCADNSTENASEALQEKDLDAKEQEVEKAEVVDNANLDAGNNVSGVGSAERPYESRSPSLAPTDTDENTQMSFADGANSDVPEVTIDESDFVLEKELFDASADQKNNQESSVPNNYEDCSKPISDLGESAYVDSEASQDPPPFRRNQENEEEEHLENNRTQEEVDTRNEEALVDLFREESDPDKIENDLEQPSKKTKKKLGTKKIKKKGKKLKKGLSKKNQSRQGGPGVEDQRFVELRGDRHSIESREEGEVDAGGHVGLSSDWGEVEERLALDRGSNEQLFDINSSALLDDAEDGEQREPGEIVEEGTKRKSGKKREREKKRKKKSRREVATIEEGVQGDDDSQKFPSFLAGFFVQDEDGEEDIADKMENISHTYEIEEERTFQKGGKTYRKRHDSGAEDSVKSCDEALEGVVAQETRAEETDHRKGRTHEERRHSSREHRHHDNRDTREVRREKDHRHGTPRDKEREKNRDRERSRHDRERVRDRENRDREVRERDRERERSRRGEREERRRRRTSRSGSRERRRRSGSMERNRRSRSRERAVRHRRHRSRSQERDRDRERARRSNRERSRERESERRGGGMGRRASHSRSHSPRHRSERGSSNKENREESHHSSRRRVVNRTHQEGSDSEERDGRRLSHQRRQRRERERERDRDKERERERSSSSSSASSSSSSSSSDPTEANRHYRSHRDQYSHEYHSDHREHHHKDYRHHHEARSSSSDEGASSDVILVEPEKIVINLDEEEDPPSRVDITHANAEDDSTTMVDGESIPPPPDLRQNMRASALIEITQETTASSGASQVLVDEEDQEEGDATPTRDERSDEMISKQQQNRQSPAQETAAEVGDYDPAHPTEEAEERESQPHTPVSAPAKVAAPPLPNSQAEPQDSGPVPPSHPPPQEIRPSPPPVPAMPEPAPAVPPLISEGASAIRPQLAPNQFQNGPFPQPQHPPAMHGQQLQRFPHGWNMANRPNGPGMPGLPNNQRGLLPTPDTQPLFPVGDELRQRAPFLQGRRDQPLNQNRPPVPISAMAPLAQLTSLLPALERAKMSSYQNNDSSSQVFKEQPFPLSSSSNTSMKAPLMSNPGPNLRPQRAGRGGLGDASESTEVIDMDMSPGEDDCELELPSPHSSDSDRDDRRRRSRKSDSHSSRGANDISRGAGGRGGGPIQPAVYLKALSKVIEKLTPKGQPVASGGGAPAQDKAKSQERRRRRPVEVSAEDDVPASAVELTNKEKYLKKLHLQERVIDEVKLAIKPFYSSKKINKDQYKLILRKAVPKVCHSKSERINPQKIQQLVEAYVGKLAKGSTLGGGHGAHGNKRKKGAHPAGAGPPNKEGPGVGGAAPHVRQNGDRGKKSNR